ncbi:transglutaminase family protein [Dactylosporangium sp. NPDC050588]|uniref:transglutaminase-like domain-containing protein n=1 Tax=Dactylosporangium sp. NPDC050588 TaxID=3157211 RepID=UPI0033CA24E9
MSSSSAADQVGCSLVLEVATPATVVLQTAPARRPGTVVSERLEAVSNSVPMPTQELAGPVGGRQYLVHLEPGTGTVSYEATVTTGAVTPDAVTAEARVEALRPSRYCPSDRLAGFTRATFGDIPAARPRVEAICDHVWRRITYAAGTSGPGTDAVDTLLDARGVCRDFAHLVAALCRAAGVPARIASVYAPGLSPMDFHAVVETEIDGCWQVWDATRLAPRQSLVRIATGRDAADTAFMTVVSGRVDLQHLEVVAVAGADLPADDHGGLVALR